MDLDLVDINASNLDEYNPTCFLNPQNIGCRLKREWLLQRFQEGLKIKLLHDPVKGKNHGYIEYVPGHHAWRAVNAPDYMFIHCIWVNPNKLKNQGLGSRLIQACLEDARGMAGVAAVCSDDSFMAGRQIFLRNGFELVAQSGKQQLAVKAFGPGPLPSLRGNPMDPDRYRGWHLLYSKQCPWVGQICGGTGPQADHAVGYEHR